MDTRSKVQKKASNPLKITTPTKQKLVIDLKDNEDEELSSNKCRKRKLSNGNSEQAMKMAKVSQTTRVVTNHLNRVNSAGTLTTNKAQIKRLTIKNYKEVPKLPENFEEEMWKKLEAAVEAIFQKEPINENLNILFNAVKDLCAQNFGGEMYRRLCGLCENQLTIVASKILEYSQSLSADRFLAAFHDCWIDHCDQMQMIRNIFLYLDRTYVIQLADIKSIWDLGLSLFSSKLLNLPTISTKLIQEIIDLINKERSGDLIQRSLLQTIIRCFLSLQFYSSFFEPQFLAQSTQFFQFEANQKFETISISDYLHHIDDRLKQEIDRVHIYLDKSTLKPLISIIENEFIVEYCIPILDKGFESLVDQNHVDDLSLLYSFFDRVDKLNLLEDYFSKYIKSAGLEIVLPEEKDNTMIEDLLTLKSKLDQLLKLSFKSNPHFESTLKKSFQSAINQRDNKPSELLAKFVDSKLRSGKNGESEEELEILLDQILSIFRLVQGKDIFQAFFRNDLAKRLLLGKSSDFDTEKSLISKLRQECGGAYTHKFEAMFTDVDLSRDIMQSFQDSRYFNEISSNFDLNVNVLTTGTWPPYPPVEINLPQIVVANQEVFERFYKQKYQGRKLTWLNSMGHCILNAAFPKGQKSLCVSLFQSAVLLLFNSSIKLSYREILSALKLNEKELKLTLQSLACGKIRVLVKNPKGKDIGDEDQFIVNHHFVHKLVRIRINSIQLIESKEERDKTNSHVLVERQYAIDAAIVRIMKERKKLSYTVLVSELYQQLRFPVQPSVIKDRVTSLIDRDYLERDEKNDQILHYLA